MVHYFRKIYRIKAEHSPNVRLAMEEQALGMEPSGEIVIPGVLPWNEYCKRRTTWDEVRQCVGLDAEFWLGAETLLFPPVWLNRSELIAEKIRGMSRKVEAIGIDSAAGGNNTAWSMIDRYGLIEMESRHTYDTYEVPEHTRELMEKYGVPDSKVGFDVGGGGRQHADLMRRWGLKVHTVAFGEPPTHEVKRSKKTVREQIQVKERRYTYKNRRAEMYGEFSMALDPAEEYRDPDIEGFAIPARFTELRRQLSKMPKRFDGEGRLELPPKKRKRRQTYESTKDSDKSLEEILGCSPDEADSLVVAYYILKKKTGRVFLGRL